VGILGFAAILVLMALPRGRESARMVGCQKNIKQIGDGLQLYHQLHREYPTVPKLGDSVVDGPIKVMLDSFVLPEFLELGDPNKPPKPTRLPTRGSRVPGLSCPSDPNAMANPFAPTISYRANTGDDPTGLGGPFQPGRRIKSDQIEAADGLSYTSGFAERLVGDGQDGHPALWNYATSTQPIGKDACPDAPLDRWKGDAGADWAEASWRSTLYGHVLRPNAEPSCLSEDRRTARMGASSGHINRVHVLMMDGSVRGITPTIEPKVWQALGTVGDLAK
jgi:Protein of unknown function (DUF1559)